MGPSHAQLILASGIWLVLLIPVIARIGIDLSVAIASSSKWASYFSSSDLESSFGIVHAVLYDGSINPNLIPTIKSAWGAGTKDLSVYVYPCISTSPYAINNAVSCGSPEAQLDALINHLSLYNVSFRYHHITDSDATNSSNSNNPFVLDYTPFYDRYIPNYDTNSLANVTLQTLYLNVEDSMPNYYFSYLHYDNVDFLWRYARYAQEIYGIEIGFYTSLYNWLDIMTDVNSNNQRVYFYSDNSSDFVTRNPFAQHKLWIPRYDQDNSMSFFRSFADWQEVFIKQTTGGSSDARRLTDNRVCTDFIADLQQNSTIISPV